jgi:hypothetical protein
VNQSMAATTVANPKKIDARNAILLIDIAVQATQEVPSRAHVPFVSFNTSTLSAPFGNICYD